MDKLNPEEQDALRKINTDRLRSKLVKAGYDEDIVFATERPALLQLMAELMLQPQVVEGAVGGDPVTPDPTEIRMKEVDLKERELRLREAELSAAREQHAAELELRKAEVRLQEQRMVDDMEWRRVEAKRLRERDEQMSERENSLPAITKKYGDIMKHVLPRMPTDPGELMTFWDTCENLWSVYEVPENLRAKLLLPLLTPKAKSLVSRLKVDDLSDVNKIKEFLLQEFKLTSREYRARFNAASRTPDETHTLFMNRLKNLWSFYMRSRDCNNFDKLVDLVIADRLKESLSGPCLKYCLAIEGKETLSASELAALADVYDVNYTPDGRYRGGMVTNFKGAGNAAVHGASDFGQTTAPRTPRLAVPKVMNQASWPGEAGRPGVNVGQSQQSGQAQRKCWTCGSPSHLRTACPRGAGNGNVPGRSQSRPARVDACEAMRTGEESSQVPVVKWEETLTKVRVNRCIVDTDSSHVDGSVSETVADSDAPISLYPDKSRCPLATDSVGTGSDCETDCNSDVMSPQSCDCITTVQTSPLTYVQLMVEGSGPYKCLSDSGTELSVAKASVVADIYPAPLSVGQIKLQGVFGEPVSADLVNLQVTMFNPDTGQELGRPVPLMFAVTGAMMQDCDLIVPARVIRMLQGHAVSEPNSASACVLTRSQAKTSAAETSGESHSDRPVSMDETLTRGDGVTNEADGTVTDTDLVENDSVSNNADTPNLVSTYETDKSELGREQRTDATLDPCWRLAQQGKAGMVVDDGILYHWDEVNGHKVKQLCVPYGRRMQVMRLAHDAVSSGHLAGRKTRDRIRLNFFWPNLKRDVYSYTSSCVPCQLRARARRKDHVPITPMVRPSVPFVVCHADVIGPIEPPSAQGHKWALCIIDDCTRWPAVYLLKGLTAKATCQAFMELFAVTGWPEILCTDQGTNFCSRLTHEFLNRMGVSPRIHSPHHPEAAGVIERFNGSFKNMLNHAIHDYGRQWHKVVPCLVWALREVPNSTTSVSPHFLLFGRMPRGPLTVLQECWTGQRADMEDDGKPVDQYIQDLETNMTNARKYARMHADTAQQKYAEHYNKHAKEKAFQVGDQVVVLEKDSAHKVFARWKQGQVTRVRSPHSYEVQMPDGSCRWLHANKLRPFVARVQHVGMINSQDSDFGEIVYTPVPVTSHTPLPSECIDRSELSHLSEGQQEALMAVLDEFCDIFSEQPGLCTAVEHEIHVAADFKPRMTRAYRVPEVLKKEIERQVAELLELGFIVPSRSPMASGVVCVLKPDKSIRMACDYRYLNSYTVSDSYPMPNLSDVMHRVGNGRVITVCDAKSGYWQLNVKPEHRWLTAFATHHGLWEWIRMPFGLKAAGNTFVRAVQIILQPVRDFSDSYIDDLSTFSDSFESHLDHLRNFLSVIQASGLKLNFRKCSFAKSEVKYLGHVIGCGKHRPDPEKMKAVTELKAPSTKKQLKQVLGLLSYYRSYVPGFAAVAKPLTDLTKGRQPSLLQWGVTEQLAFETLCAKVSEAPVLLVPRPGQPFLLYTDASATAVACQLAQYDDEGAEHPVAYASQKLTVSQCAWSVIEREAFAIVWALQRFHNVIFGAHLTVFTDHNPLKYLTESAPKSAKLTRWALAIQQYDLTLKYTRGSANVVADSLSRLQTEQKTQ